MKIIYLYILICFAYGISVAQVSSSKDTVFSTQEINVISNRIETDIFNSPTSIKLINCKQINSGNGDRLSDVLKSSENIFLKSYGNNALTTISLNGLGAEHTLILIDGMNINSFQNSQVDLTTIPKDKIEKIEIMNNGASSIYGSSAIGGVVNIITKNNRPEKPFIKLSGSYGSYDFTNLSANYISKTNKINYDLFYSFERAKNNFEYFYNNGISNIKKEREDNDYTANNIYLNLDYNLDNKTELRYNASYFSEKRNLPGLETGSAPAIAEQRDENWNNNLYLKYNFNKNYYIVNIFNYQNNLMKYKDIYLDEFFKNRSFANNTTFNFNVNNLKNTIGYEVLYADLFGGGEIETAKRVQYSLFAASEYDYKDFIKVFPSARYDMITDIEKNILTAKFGINLKPFKKINLNFRSSAGNNFSAPTFNELHWVNAGNKNLLSEKSFNLDAGFIFKANFITENTIEFNYTKINLEDKIVWKPGNNNLWKPINIDKSESNIYSFDVNAKKSFGENTQLGIRYSYTNNKSIKTSSDYPDDPTYGKQIFYIPIELSKINFEACYKNIGINLFYSFTGKRYSDLENNSMLPVIDLLDGNIIYNFEISKIKLNTKLEINNILNEDYRVIPGYPMPLRNYKLIISLIY